MLGRVPQTKETLTNFFFKIWIPINGHNSVVSSHPKSTGIPQVDGLSTRPSDLGRQKLLQNLYKLT